MELALGPLEDALMQQDVTPFIDIANAIQALIEAVQPLERSSSEVAHGPRRRAR